MRHTITLWALALVAPMAAPKPKCGWANQLMPSLNDPVGNFEGLVLSLGAVIWIVVLAVLVVAFATKHSRTLLMVLIGVFVIGILVKSGFNPVSSPCG